MPFWYNSEFASSSKPTPHSTTTHLPHWQNARLAPVSLIIFTILRKYACSCSYRSIRSYESRVTPVATLPDLISTSCFVFGFGGSNAQVSRHTRASFSSLGICGWLKPLSSTRP